MRRICRTYQTEEYNFINFSDILKNIRDLFLDEMGDVGLHVNIQLNGRIPKKYIKHCTLTEILMTVHIMDSNKKNVIVMGSDCSVESGGLLDDTIFLDSILRVTHSSKRKIPILIKRVDASFPELGEFLNTGSGIEWLNILQNDRERLRQSTCNFQEFKKFAKKEGLKYINENLVNKIEFKRLFLS